MTTYLVLNLVFTALVVVLFRIRAIHFRVWLLTLGALLLLTLIFDNLIIYFDIVDYNVSKLLGAYIGLAPIEDFFYCLLAAFLIPTLWHKLENKHGK